MTWTIDGKQAFESAKIAHLIVPYTRGRVLDIGSGNSKGWPHFIGVDDLTDRILFGHSFRADIVSSADDLSLFADRSVDAVFSSHCLEHVEDHELALSEWWRVIRTDGYLSLYLPHKDLYPNIGEEGANPDHKHDFVPDDIIGAMRSIADESGTGWVLLENETRSQNEEYSFFLVFQKTVATECIEQLWQRNPQGKKRLLIVRFGAIGDCIQAGSVLPGLKAQGWHITFMTTPQAQEVLRERPEIDDWIIQDKGQVPPQQLAAYLEQIRERFDKVLDFCESIEGALLTLPGRTNHTWTWEARHKLLNVNYEERMHDLAGVPYGFTTRFLPTKDERREAVEYRNGISGPVVYWAIGGTAVHKLYPFTNVVISWLLQRTDAHIVLAAGPDLRELEAGLVAHLTSQGVDMSRIHHTVDDWEIRRALTFVEYADVVVGPETGILNAAAHLDVPKVVMLSHSSAENLTRHWKNTNALTPENCPCYPCHMLHYNWEFCVKVKETQAALCASNIKPEWVYKAIQAVLRRDSTVDRVAASFERVGPPTPRAAAD